VQHRLLFGGAGQAAQLGNEVADGAGVSVILVASDVSRHVARERFDVVPKGAGRIACPPLPSAPVGIGCAAGDGVFAVPGQAQVEMRVQPEEIGRHL